MKYKKEKIKMYNQNKFALKEFFKCDGLKEYNFNNIWNQVSVKIKPYQNETEKNIKKMGNFEPEDISFIDFKKIYNEYQNLWKTKGTVKGADLKKLKKYLQILFPNPNEGIPNGLYNNMKQFDDFLETLIKKNSQANLRRLFSDLLYHYPEDKPLLFKRLEKIYNNLDKQRRSNQSLIKANDEFLLTKEKGVRIIADNILDIRKNLSSEVLSRIWLKERHLISNGIGKSIVENLCDQVKNFIQKENEMKLERFLKYLSGDNNIARFSNPNPIVSVLLRPFKKKTPKPLIKKEITKFLDQYVGDPRFESEKWINMDREKLIFLQWKIGETLKDFFELLSYTAKQDPDADRMWPYRKEFIEAYWTEGHIKDAWIVLGKEAYKNRLTFLKEDFKNYGKIVKGCSSIHSVLLFHIGDLVLSEWNYNGKVRVWNSSLNQYSPQFYKTEYSRENLVTNPKTEFIHSRSDKYYWQKKLSRYIKRYTGIQCPEHLQRQIYKFQ